jgi:hypothetical protein
MDYGEVSAGYEKGAAWHDWQDADTKDVLQMRLIALRHREALCKHEAQRLHQKSELLNELLMTM